MKTLAHDHEEHPVPELVNEQQQVKGLLRTFLALRHSNFRLFWFGQLISLVGTWMQTTAQAWLVLELTHSAWLLGVVGALQFLQVIYLSLFGGDLLIAWLGLAPLFLLNAISFIAVIIGLALIEIKELHTPLMRSTLMKDVPKQSTLQSLREGLAYVAHTPSVLLIIIVVGVISLFGINFNVVLPLFATDVLHSGPQGFGFISSAFGLGSLFSALWLACVNNMPSIRRLLAGALAFCVLEILFAVSHLYLLSLVLIAAVGFSQIVFSAAANTTLQTVAPDYLRGRLMSVYILVFAGTVPLGNLFTGGIAHLFGAPIALLLGAVISLIAAIVGWVLRRPAEKNLAEASLITS